MREHDFNFVRLLMARSTQLLLFRKTDAYKMGTSTSGCFAVPTREATACQFRSFAFFPKSDIRPHPYYYAYEEYINLGNFNESIAY